MALRNAPSIDSQLPWKFANGAELSSLEAVCSGCRKDLSGTSFTGHLHEHSPKMVIVDAVGVCSDCKIIEGCNYRIFDDLHREGMSRGRWGTWLSHRTTGLPGLWNRLRGRLSKL